MGEAGRAALGLGVTGLLNPVPAQRARLLLAQGDVAAAACWAEERGLGPGDEPGYPREPEYPVLARVLLAQDRPAQALAHVGRMRRRGPHRQRHRDRRAAGAGSRRASGGRPGHGEKHVSHLLGKLGAANRTQAVTRARQLGLIP
jgi:hypothetical protein